ncbi:MAG TPA: hypothetical protein VJ550_13605 [Geomonas sp.]|nr:hypothetical protein [Geomonas sp.]
MKPTARIVTMNVMAGVLAAGLGALPAWADTGPCIQNNYALAGNSGTLGCTANDVKIAALAQVIPATDASGNDISGLYKNSDGSYSCIQDSSIQFTGLFKVVANASQRYDIGLYIAGQENSAKVGTTCNRTVLLQTNTFNSSALSSTTLSASSSNYDNFTVPLDACGDVTSTHSPYYVSMNIQTKCEGTGQLNLPNCTSWLEKEKKPCGGIQDAVPGTTSKCNCDALSVQLIQVKQPSLQVTKVADQVSVDPNTPVNYTVTITNGSTSSVKLTTLTESSGTNVSCPSNNSSSSGFTQDFTYNFSGSGNSVAVQCGLDTLDSGKSTTCTFSRVVSGNPSDKIADNVCINGTSQFGAIAPACGCTSVSINDVKPTAQVDKSVVGAVCTTVRFKASVKNTDQYGRQLTLTGLSDSVFGAISSANPKISATSCQFPQTLEVSDPAAYSCTFDAQVCNGEFPHSNTVTASLYETATNNAITPTSGQPLTITGVTVVTP